MFLNERLSRAFSFISAAQILRETSSWLPLDSALILHPCRWIYHVWGPLTFSSKLCSLPYVPEHFPFVQNTFPAQLFWPPNITQQIPVLPFILMPAPPFPRPAHEHTFASLPQNAYQPLNSQTMISSASIHTGNGYVWGFIGTQTIKSPRCNKAG